MSKFIRLSHIETDEMVCGRATNKLLSWETYSSSFSLNFVDDVIRFLLIYRWSHIDSVMLFEKQYRGSYTYQIPAGKFVF